ESRETLSLSSAVRMLPTAFGFDLANSEGVTLVRTYRPTCRRSDGYWCRAAWNRWRCKNPKRLLNHGDFLVSPRIGIFNVSWIVYEDAVLQFRVNLRHGVSPLWHALSEESHPGLIAPILDWSESQFASQIAAVHLRAP